jgi:hypothetical protein
MMCINHVTKGDSQSLDGYIVMNDNISELPPQKQMLNSIL